MLKCRADGGDSGLDFFLRCIEHPAVNGRGCLNCLGSSVKVDGCEDGMDESSEPPPAGSLIVRARTDDHLNIGLHRRRIARFIFPASVVLACRGAREGGDGLCR
jgi:hypothetical protein